MSLKHGFDLPAQGFVGPALFGEKGGSLLRRRQLEGLQEDVLLTIR
ncbi:MAG: hypothetical protein HYR84_03305 [Planctomycetes bacterium]|nr:hypothetical protein [Planctomycetota bacterium]